jgi:hypothetical protein
MTSQLDAAFARAAALPNEEQDELAQLIIDMIEADMGWDRAFMGSQDQLARLADQVREEIRAGKTEELGPDRL